MLIISEGTYKMEKPEQWLVFAKAAHAGIHPVLAGRLAYLCACKGKKLYISRGFVTYEEQKAIGEAKLKANPGWYRSKSGAVYKPAVIDEQGRIIKPAVAMVAAPGNSNHEFRHAVDSGDVWFKALSNKELAPFGLYKPISEEPWHVQLIETKGVGKDAIKKDFEEYMKGGGVMDIAQFQTAMKAIGLYTGKIDGIVGKMTRDAAEKCIPLLHQILGTDYKTAEETIKATQNGPDLWLPRLNEIPFFDAFVMNIVKKMKGTG